MWNLPPDVAADFFRAVHENLADPDVVAFARGDARTLPELVSFVQLLIPYGYDGPSEHLIMSYAGSAARRYWSCADAAAFLAAIAVERDVRPLRLCVERHPDVPSYSHVRMVAAGAVLEPFPSRRWEVAACSGIVDVRAMVR